MTHTETYNKVFTELFEIDKSLLNENLAIRTFPRWDSIVHLSLVSQLEDVFDIMLDPEDILGFRSYVVGKDILAKYGITVD